MAEQIKCPVCGEMNAAELELCTNCRSPLQPKSNIPSGQNPTKKHTAELEPILPQWLREARDAARNTEPDDSPDFLQTAENKPKPSASTPDLLAGLQSQTEDDADEEVPDWLASITGDSPKSKLAKDEPTTDVRWVEMGNKDDFAQSENILAQPPSRGGQEENDDVPAWLAGLQDESAPEEDELSGWMRDTNEAPVKDETPTFEATTSQEDTPDWLKQMSAEAETKSEDVSSQPVGEAQFDVESPDWLKQMSASAEPVEAKTQQDAPEFNIDTPDWINTLGNASENASGEESAAFTESNLPENEAEALPPMDMPDWLKSSDEAPEEKPSQDTTTPLWLKAQVQSQEPEMPAWLSSEDTVFLNEEKEEPAQDDLLGDVPDWLKAAAPEKTIFDSDDELKSEVDSADSTDWFSTIQPSGETEVEEKGEPEKVDPFASMPAFTPDAETDESIDSLFTEMPDWLSGVSEQPSSPAMPTPITNEDVLPSSNLPSWVEAMRPSDSGLSQLTSSTSDQTLESRGALAGLQGVLPAVPGFTPTSKPKAYSLKLNANDEQLRHAGILEDILAAETSPVPIESFSTLLSSPVLRWTLAFLMLAVVFSTTFLRTEIFSLPRGTPSEVGAAIQVMQSIPENAPLLVAFDYEPSRAAEMEVAAAPMFDNLLLLKHPRLTFIATNETGSVLAERFISSGPLAVHNYQSGVTYSNLGYLPGGQLGIRAFAQNPSVISPFDISGQPAWASAPLAGISALNQFTAMILITDNADAARVWVEQTQGLRGNIPFIVVSSSQSTPMIQPYYDSGQINGIVPGLYGGAIFEQHNAGRPGSARNYWDAYSIGMLIAMILVLGGGLWNLILGLRERRESK